MTVIERDLAAFADLGTDAPRTVSDGNIDVIRIVRNGRELQLVIHPDGAIVEQSDGADRRHRDMAALLASPNFGDLGRWAGAQTILLRKKVASAGISIRGQLSPDNADISLKDLELLIAPPAGSAEPNLSIFLVDGPAGIGKTSLIQWLAYKRADTYLATQRPLIFHVESRGRPLPNIVDLMAFSLQTLRVNVTYDQIPVLVRHGLVTLVIDGFDELADPNGYELAWAQVNELITASRGRGSLIFAGRETFIKLERLKAALTAFRESVDILRTYTVLPIEPQTAKDWLRGHGWTDESFNRENVEPIFELGSYALRPFFLSVLAEKEVREQVEKQDIDDLTWFLVDTMIRRETKKFGDQVDSVTTDDDRETFVIRFLGEVARDLADNQTEAIPGESLAWLAEYVAAPLVPASAISILKHRANVVAFLVDDDRRGYRRFSHAQLSNHFLSRITVEAVRNGDVPKYIRRNILGADFLDSFADVLPHLPADQLSAFMKQATDVIDNLGDVDRSRRNLATLVILASGICDEPRMMLSDVSMDEALVVQTAGPLELRRVVIAQLDARDADIRTFQFDSDCYVVSLIGNSGTKVSSSFPFPDRIQTSDGVLTTPAEVRNWIDRSRGDVPTDPNVQTGVANRDPVIELLDRACRYRTFWIRDSDDRASRRILNDSVWDQLRRALERHDLIQVRRNVQAGGPGGEFFHIRQKEQLLARDTTDAKARAFLEEIGAV